MVGDNFRHEVVNLQNKEVEKMKRLIMLVALVVCLLPAAAFAVDFEVPIGAIANLGPVVGWLGIACVAYLALLGYRKFVKTANRT